LIVVSLSGTAYWACSGGILWSLGEPWLTHPWTQPILAGAVVWAVLGVVLLAMRTLFWMRYRAFPSSGPDDAPFLTVIIPAYNEGAMVQKSIDSVASAHYPRDHLEIFVVDDGSRDDTWVHIQAAAARHPGLVSTLRFPKNRGKRAALEVGFRRAKGEIVATIDSDSVIDAGTLLALAGPFSDPKVGAVAGRVSVYNRRQGLIPRMLQVRYTLSFDFLRAAQSGFQTVYCCPGALAGYRASVVRTVLDTWMKQTFLGARCTYGEDRSMTNYILDQGYDTVYQRSAVVHTMAPMTYSKLCKMYLRWDRSYVREEVRLARILWKRPLFSRAMVFYDFTVTNLRFPVGYTSLGVLTWIALGHPAALLRLMFAMGVMAAFSMLYYLRSERSWDFIYGILYAYYSFFVLLWVFPYAVLTVRSRSWMTR